MVDFAKRLARPPLPPCAHMVINVDGMCENCGVPVAAGARAQVEELEQGGGCDLSPAEPVDIPVEVTSLFEAIADPLVGLDEPAAPAEPPAEEAPEVDPDTAALVDMEADVESAAGPPDEPQFLYIAGTAGTGKSYQARQRAKLYPDAILTASTGIAAVNLEGTTINSVLNYYDTGNLQTNYELGRLNQRLRALALSGFTRLIIDECSMMDGRQLDILCMAIDEVNEWLAKEDKPVMGLTLVGDFAQLPPVEAPYCFQQPSWERFENNTIMLTEPRRQADPDFVRALQAVRRGDKQAAVNYFTPLITSTEERNFDGTTIMAKNDEVDRYNKIRMSWLPGAVERYESVRTGDHLAEWKNIPQFLELKPNCLVMILSNRFTGPADARELIYANGDLAHYIKPMDIPGRPFDPKTAMAYVKLIRDGSTQIVTRVLREKKVPTGAKGVKKEREHKEGSIDYLPLRVAYGSTVHKAQGLTLDRVQLMINSQFWMKSGMLYVGLSRARTPQGLRIVGSVKQFEARVRANPLIARWL